MKAVDAETMAPARRAGWAQGVLAAAQTARLPLTLGAVLLAAVALRLWGLGHKSLWFDEAYSVYIARQALGEIPRLLRLYDTHPPLYYVLLHLWMGVAGQSEVAVRVPSVVASLAAIGLTYLLGRRLAGEGVGLLAAVLLAASPFQVTAAQEARMYPFLMLFGVGASYALWLALAEGRRRYWMGYVLCLVLALYTHHFAVLLLLAHGVYVLGIHRERQAMRAWLFAVAVVVILYLPLVPMLVTQVSTARAWPNFRPPFGLRAITDMFGMFSFGGGLFGMGTYFRRGSLPLEDRGAILLPFALLLFAGAAGLEGSRRRVFTLTYWLLPVATVALVSFRWNMFYERYFSFVLPAFYVLLAAGVTHLAGFARGRGRTVAVVAVLLLVASFNLPALANVYREKSTYDWRAAAQHVATQARPGDYLLFIPGFARIPFQYYFNGPQVQGSLNPTLVRAEPAQVRLSDGDAARLTAIAQQHARMWIVATIPIGYEARKEINKLLVPVFREVEGRSFGLVFTFLWESRVYGGASGRR